MLPLLSSHPSPFYASGASPHHQYLSFAMFSRFSFTVLCVIFVLLESIPRPQGADGDWSSAGNFGSSSPILHSQGRIGTVTSFFYFSRTTFKEVSKYLSCYIQAIADTVVTADGSLNLEILGFWAVLDARTQGIQVDDGASWLLGNGFPLPIESGLLMRKKHRKHGSKRLATAAKRKICDQGFRGILILSFHFPGTNIVTSQLSHMGLAPSSDFLDATVTES
ncbi:hypothetical protein CISG_02047 [Coccidioides immitis RMSCC 3703]|uniref:Uncharacterized protein n=1 Tax=Coccidioides immitis RMSCC 3703 TaxID=454286 RepID=A0A0J8R398_COCIT|nr:hypothetical protein CISG_02047 [Coccidioides immitis RMSCC 3703]